MSENTLLVLLLVLGFGAVVVRAAYKSGYENGRKDVLDPSHLRPLTEEQKTSLLMKRTLPRWRRIMGWIAIAVPGLLFWVLLYGAIHYGGGSGWAFLLAVLLSFVLLGAGVWSMEWFWRPFRQAQEEARQAKRRVESGRPGRSGAP